MAGSDQSNRSKAAAAALKKRGIFHGKRMSSPYPNSGGRTMSDGPGSSKYQRLLASRGRRG